MKRILSLAAIVAICAASVMAQSGYNYKFRSTPLAEAITRIASDHPELNINFIYNQLEHYRTSAHINSADPVEALRQTVGRNPVSVRRSGNNLWVEALQQGKFIYTGRAVAPDGVPVEAATVMLLAPADSAVLTFGVTDAAGRFSIPCDSRPVIAKLTCLGYRPTYHRCPDFSVGTVTMPVAAVRLAQAEVQARTATLSADRTVYRPSQRQKKASQTAIDLLARLSSPELIVYPDKGEVNSLDGRPASLFIDYLPATEAELKGMNMADVLRVEVLNNPSDPRFNSKPFVVNFIMQQYLYGGYTKGAFSQSVIRDETYGSLNSRMQYKAMQYDVHANIGRTKSTHDQRIEQETYRLLQPDGELRTIARTTEHTDGLNKTNTYAAAFKATYRSDKITAASTLTGLWYRVPHEDYSGRAVYSAPEIAPSDFTNDNSRRIYYVNYDGNYYFSFGNNDALNFTPAFTRTHTRQHSMMAEQGVQTYTNDAKDRTDLAVASVDYSHNFSEASTLGALIGVNHTGSRTTYAGTADAIDRARMTDLEASLSYNYRLQKLYLYAKLAWKWTWLGVNDVHEFRSSPTASLMAQYTPTSNHRFSIYANYEQVPPSLQNRSDVVVHASRFFSYTGNPALIPTGWFYGNVGYTLIPGNNYSVGVTATHIAAIHRYSYLYESTPDYILRTIGQPMGAYWINGIGLNASLSLLDRSLQFSASSYFNHYHSGEPYEFSRSSIRVFANAYYYIGDFNFSASYRSDMREPSGFMTGAWMRMPSRHSISAGWSHGPLNVEVEAVNFARWRWTDGLRQTLTSTYFDRSTVDISGYYHAHFSLSLTYTIGYGKKVNRGNDLGTTGRPADAILK